MVKTRIQHDAEPPVIDRAALQASTGADPELERQLAAAFLAQSPALQRDLARAARETATSFGNQLVRLRGACQLLAASRALSALDAVGAAYEARRVSRAEVAQVLVRELRLVEDALLLSHDLTRSCQPGDEGVLA